MAKTKDKEVNRIDDAARAGWLYYVAGHNQDEVAVELGVSRQSAQRLISLAISEKLVTFRIDHPIARCMEISEKIKERFGLKYCEIVPNDLNPETSYQGLPQACASYMEKFLKSEDPKTITLGTGRVLRAGIDQLTSMDCSQHKIVSLVGNIAPDGSASSYDVIMRIADRIKAPHYPMPLPVIADSAQERDILQQQNTVKRILDLAKQSDVSFVGIGHLGKDAPLFNDGFISAEELSHVVSEGAVGEIIGWVFDDSGNIIKGAINDRVASAPIQSGSAQIVFGVAAGKQKIKAIFGALQGKLINSLITNEYTAERLLRK